MSGYFLVCAMECTCVQTRPQFILSFERVLGNGVRTHADSEGKIPCTGGSEEGRTHNAASCRTASPTHYWLAVVWLDWHGLEWSCISCSVGGCFTTWPPKWLQAAGFCWLLSFIFSLHFGVVVVVHWEAQINLNDSSTAMIKKRKKKGEEMMILFL